MKLSRYLVGLPPAPPSRDWSGDLTQYGEMLNDQLGDCLVGETLAVAPRLLKSYRSLYDGPIVSVKTGTGKRLTSTRNHMVLTSRGFVPAYQIKEGDHVVSCDFPQAVAARMNNDFANTPSSIEDVFETNKRIALPGSIKRKMGRTVDFHGDAEFFKSEIDIVDADRLLQGSNATTHSEPECQQRLIFAVGTPIPFNGLRASCSNHGSVLPSPSCVMSVGRMSLSLFRGVLRGANHARFLHRPKLYASPTKKGINSSPADPELVSELIGAFPGQVRLDRVVGVESQNWRGHVYDLSTQRQWYIANGIVTHNCTIAALGHACQTWSMNSVGLELTVPDSVILGAYEKWCGYNPNDPSTDNGGVEIDVLNSFKRDGLGGHALLAYADPKVHNLGEVRQAINLFGGVYIGITLTNAQVNAPVWDVIPNDNSGIAGGHAVWVPKYDEDGSFTCVTWGQLQKMTVQFWKHCVQEAHALLSPVWINSQTGAPSGFPLTQLEQDLAAIR